MVVEKGLRGVGVKVSSDKVNTFGGRTFLWNESGGTERAMHVKFHLVEGVHSTTMNREAFL